MTDTTDNALLPCHSCGSRLGPFLSAPDGNQQVICSTCGMRGPYENLVETAPQKWNSLTPATEAQVMAHPNVQELVDALRPFAEAFEIAKNEGTRSLGLIEANAYYHLKGGSFRKAHTALAALTTGDSND
jgi:hypothetical protein